MHNSKIYSILVTFDKYEQNRFRKFLHSPYFNQNQFLSTLLEFLIRHINKNPDKEMDKKKCWNRLHLGKPYNDVRFRKYMSELLKLSERFLALQIFESKPMKEAAYSIEAVADRKMKRLYNSSMKNVQRLTENHPYRNTEFFYNQYLKEKNYFDLTDFETKRGTETNVEEISDNLDAFYLGEKLRLSCEVLSRQTVKHHQYDLKFVEEIIKYVEENDFSSIPPVALYYQIHLLYTDPENEDHYFKLKELLNDYALQFPINESRDELYMSAQNYCIKKINQGNPRFLKELFSLYQTLLDREILISEGELSPWYFRNIVVVALRLKEYKWTEKFIFEKNKFLPRAFKENAVTFNLANLYFYQKNYNKVIEQLQNVEFEDFTYNLNSKAMLIATYYEIDEVEPLFSLLESFRTYLNRHKEIPERRRKNFLNLIKYTKRLAKIMPGDKKLLKKLSEDMDASQNTANEGWLREKITELS